jgi:hypothetical protein
MYQILVWVCLAVDQMRSMAVTSGAWQSLIVAWGNPTNFIGTSVFPVLTVPLTGIGESFTQPILQRTDLAINRILHCSDFFCLVSPHKTSFSGMTSKHPHRRIWTLKKEFKIYRIISSIICLVSSLSWFVLHALNLFKVAFMQLAAAIARGVAVRCS